MTSDGNTGELWKGMTYWGEQPVEFYSSGYAHFPYVNWLGCAPEVICSQVGVGRLRSAWKGLACAYDCTTCGGRTRFDQRGVATMRMVVTP
jgi:hypothetical protein